jgi:flagella synthesis protein FlgN
MLETQLAQQLQNLTDLLSILEEEKRCLAEKDFSSFNEILFNKQKSLQIIATLDKQLTTEKSLQDIDKSDTLSALKDNVQALLEKCQETNDVNGKLVQLSMKSNKHLMQLMTQAKGKNSVTYDQKGTLQSGQLLGKNIQA